MSRNGRYSKKSTPPEQLSQEAATFLNPLQIDFQAFQNNELHPALLLSNYLISINKFRKGSNWKGSKFHWFQPLAADEFINFWGSNLLRSMPWKVNYVLINWYLGHFPLKLINYIPDAKEMLQLQAKGERFVTILTEEHFWTKDVLHERDHFSFVVHDLIHAFEFFYHNHLKIEQIKFYQMLESHYEKLSTYDRPEKFKDDLNYLISDMNSHPKHLEAYFTWLLQEHEISI